MLGHLTPSYKWAKNSCWLDTSLEILWCSLLPSFEDFASCFSHISDVEIQSQPLYSLFHLLQFRQDLYTANSENHTVEVLSAHRDVFREVLAEGGIISTAALTGFDSISVSTMLLSEIVES